MAELVCEVRQWHLREPFTVARRSVDTYDSLTIAVRDGEHEGRGEATGVYYEGETVASMRADLERVDVLDGLPARDRLTALKLSNGARAALDAALWDLEAKQEGRSVADMLDLPPLRPLATAVTLSRDTPEAMARAVGRWHEFAWLKVKVGGDGDIAQDIARIAAVREACGPDVGLIVDPNSSWSADSLEGALPQLRTLGVNVLEQPTMPGHEPDLGSADLPITVCADEAVRGVGDLANLHSIYGMINIKLEKAGGLTGGLQLLHAARERQMQVMIGCMNGTSLALAPAIHLAQLADLADLDAPLDLVQDRPASLQYINGMLHPPQPELWG